MISMVDSTQPRHRNGSGAADGQHVLVTLTSNGGVGSGDQGVGLVQVEAVEVQSEEADVGLTLAHVDGAGGGGGLGPVGQVLTVAPATVGNEVTTNSKSSCTSASCGTSL